MQRPRRRCEGEPLGVSGDRDLVALALGAAENAEDDGRSVTASLLRRLAQRVAELSEATVEQIPGRCRGGCGRKLERTGKAGRPREFCLVCRPRDRRTVKLDAKCRMAA